MNTENEISQIWKNLPLDISKKIYYELLLDEIIDYILNKFEVFEQKNTNQDKSNIFCELVISKRISNEDYATNNSFLDFIILCRYGKRYITLYETIVNKDEKSQIIYYENTNKSYSGFDNKYFKVIFESCIKKIFNFEKNNKNYKLIYKFKEVNLDSRPDAEYKYYNDIPIDLFEYLENL